MSKISVVLGVIVLSVFLVLLSARAAVVEVDITIKDVDPQSRQITVTYDARGKQKEKQLDVSRRAEITASGKLASLDALKSGDQATVSFDKELEIVTRITLGKGNTSTSLGKGNEDRPFVVTVGPMRTLMEPGINGLFTFPDQRIKVLHDDPLAFLLVAAPSTYLMVGKSFGEAKPVRRLLEPGQKGDFDSQYAGSGAAYHLKDRKEWLLFYHAENHEGMGRVNTDPHLSAGYWSVGMAVWDETTNTVTKKGQVLRASIPKNPRLENHGNGDVALVCDPSGQYLYLYYFDLTRKEPISQIGVARCAISDAARTDKWFKYYDGRFNEPGLGGKEFGIVPRVWEADVQYVRSFGCYIMVCVRACGTDIERAIPQDGGICWCYSKDGIHWSEPQLVVPGLPLPFPGKSYTPSQSCR